ncbi:EAL domain-containing protein [Solirubrobacter phytolaccae]|uniref:EAL domain-containing protein n=1 Tax=Solirubrobacter phytolaccae TaxID=1404360 RepID=A0A9X3NHC3_9ACTN|nr:EAL domain-containing protein [Solirubrobacter phytolaccae]MDA0181257.1 EAL domain-containing protein [Solirubrobacter phytolaccae]
MFVEAAGGVLVCGSLACVVAAVVGRRSWLVAVLFALALACAAADAFGADSWLHAVACGFGFAGAVTMVLQRLGKPLRLSWIDFVMGGCAVGALSATTGAELGATLGASGVAAALGLARWRVSTALALALIGLIALGELPVLAVLPVAVAMWLKEPPATPSPVFNPIVLAALLAYAAAAMVLLVVGQFVSLPADAATLATITMLAGMARAGLTVVDRLKHSHYQAVTDDLTGLGNRRQLLDALREAIAVEGQHVALLLIDLDGFKELNDTLGHHAGDEVLRQIGPRLEEALHPEDTLARLGGDEFAVVLAPGDEASASAAGLRLRSSLERSFSVGGIRVHIDASIGIALFPEHSQDALGLLQRADVAMYEAKRTRTGHEVYLPERDTHSRRRLELLGELRDALANDELILHYQPKADIATGEVHGVEALVRWAHPRRGLLMPSDFLPLADHSGLGRSLTAFVLDRALVEIGQRRSEGFDLSVAVNLSPADLLDLGLPSDVARTLERHAFPASCLRLEVSEDAVMADPERSLEVLRGLRAIGVATALDDFGSGHVSLGHLKHLGVDEIKIDRSFVLRLAEDERDAAIVHTTVDLGRRLGMKVVAEGVETVEAWDALAVLHCDEAQGFFLGRPMTATALAGWMRDRAAAA